METSPIRQLVQQALQNDQRVDPTEFDKIRQSVESAGKAAPEDIQLLTDCLVHNQIDAKAIPAAIGLLAKYQSKPGKSDTPAAAQPGAKPEVKPDAKAEAKPEEKKPEPPKSPWTKTYTVQGNFNHTSVSSGWNGQYGAEKTATKIEGSFQTEVNYQADRRSWKNKLLVEYGNTFVKGDEKTAITRNNLEFTSEAGRTLEQHGAIKIEIPYATLYTKGPLTEIDGRKFRETTGAKISFKPSDQSEYSLKVGAGFQQVNDPAKKNWNNEFGVEAVIEAKQSLGFMKAPLVKATGIKSESLGVLDRVEGQAQVNAFNPLQNGFAVSNTDIGIKLGGRYYLTDKKNVWFGVGQEYQYGGKADSTWERKFSADAGFKFN